MDTGSSQIMTSSKQDRPVVTGSNRTPLTKLNRFVLNKRSVNSRSRASLALKSTQHLQAVTNGMSPSYVKIHQGPTTETESEIARL